MLAENCSLVALLWFWSDEIYIAEVMRRRTSDIDEHGTDLFSIEDAQKRCAELSAKWIAERKHDMKAEPMYMVVPVQYSFSQPEQCVIENPYTPRNTANGLRKLHFNFATNFAVTFGVPPYVPGGCLNVDCVAGFNNQIWTR